MQFKTGELPRVWENQEQAGELRMAYDRDSHIGKLARGLDEADARGWIVVSMKGDWKMIFE